MKLAIIPPTNGVHYSQISNKKADGKKKGGAKNKETRDASQVQLRKQPFSKSSTKCKCKALGRACLGRERRERSYV